MITRSLQYLMENNQHTSTTSPSPLHDDFVALGDFDPSEWCDFVVRRGLLKVTLSKSSHFADADTGETPVLSDAQVKFQIYF